MSNCTAEIHARLKHPVIDGDGHCLEPDFREFTFSDAAMLHARNNPRFFKGSVVEQAVADELA